jgi:hypothetical protein
VELYNLADDHGERNNLAQAEPELAAKLERRMAELRMESAEFPLEKSRQRSPERRLDKPKPSRGDATRGTNE